MASRPLTASPQTLNRVCDSTKNRSTRRTVELSSAIRILLVIMGYLTFRKTKAYVIGESLLSPLFQMLDNVVWRRTIKNADRVEEQISTLAAHPFVANLN